MNTTPAVTIHAWRQRHGSRVEWRYNLTVARKDIGWGESPTGNPDVTIDSLPVGVAAARLRSWGFRNPQATLRSARAGL